ncbi:MAG: hypothetical protein GY750_10755 [Lentisphaerae bacterium]|nr:hypothetical protein [Lentisphaerota bacterium]MCP4101890.1 hypothetical protein [Lentisphaerota bacterium]
MKSSFITIVFAASLILLSGCSNKSEETHESISSLLLHFQKSGLKVDPPVKRSAVEKKFYNDSMKLAELLKNKKSKLVEFREVHVQGVKVKIRRYRTDEAAANAYNSLMNLEAAAKLDYKKKGETYYRQEFMFNPPFILSVKHFKVVIKDDVLIPEPLNIPVSSLDRISNAFSSYK